jgi:hypothetical protein
VNHDVEVIALAPGVIHHRFGDRFNEISLLVYRSAFPHFDNNKGHWVFSLRNKDIN